MAFKIGESCLSCGACEAQCPNQAISQGDTIYVVNPERCTECVGEYAHAKCVDVCAALAPRKDPSRPESKEQLLAKWYKLHPGEKPKGLILTADKSRPVIALVADGSGDPVGQQTLERLDTLFRNKFPEYDVVWGFQASYMIEGLKKRGQTTFFRRRIPLMGAEDLMQKLAEMGVKKVAMQLLMVHESSYSRGAIACDKCGMEVKYALPFLSTAENLVSVVKALEPYFGDGKETATVLVGHGVLKDFEQNDCFYKMNEYLHQHYKNVHMGTLHGPPGIESIAADIKNSSCRKVRFISLMMTTSEHISVDVMGDDPASWKSIIGLPAEVVDNLCDNPLITEFFAKSVRSILDKI